ncbi:hypothetical protein Nepgr_001021 [Nepenthes gracilis]|uniref:Uncharacterized protein n=1 Tax=Nepenthes gracilis TaxID=150966 RepID=A0AAD3P7U1_NEPGR|nr:hypothetical protein Nepgr_001021 [Nepenthes gracilis]
MAYWIFFALDAFGLLEFCLLCVVVHHLDLSNVVTWLIYVCYRPLRGMSGAPVWMVAILCLKIHWFRCWGRSCRNLSTFSLLNSSFDGSTILLAQERRSSLLIVEKLEVPDIALCWIFGLCWMDPLLFALAPDVGLSERDLSL